MLETVFQDVCILTIQTPQPSIPASPPPLVLGLDGSKSWLESAIVRFAGMPGTRILREVSHQDSQESLFGNGAEQVSALDEFSKVAVGAGKVNPRGGCTVQSPKNSLVLFRVECALVLDGIRSCHRSDQMKRGSTAYMTIIGV